MNVFFQGISERQASVNSLLCVGLDPEPDRLPKHYHQFERPILQFCKDVIEVTKDLVCCYKPQFAHFAAADALEDLKEIIAMLGAEALPVILDAKRGDVSSTSHFYATEAFDVYGADAVTVNPYLGGDSIEPFLVREDRGVILLCRTSNPGGSDIQNQALAGGGDLYEHIARLASSEWNVRGNVGLVVGATRPSELARVREIVGEMFLLLPGIGAQGGDLEASLESGGGGGLIISSSRAILYPEGGTKDSVRRNAQATRDLINSRR
ncbi:MAG: orotidine-5'-phosphate decarboxylase [Betaproteobacteria bacterium]